jgi:hypothetical protein
MGEAFHYHTGETALYNDKLGGRNFSVVGFSCNLLHESHPQSRVQHNSMSAPTSNDGTKKITEFHTQHYYVKIIAELEGPRNRCSE